MAPIPDALTDPTILTLITLLTIAAAHYQRGLAWPEYRALHSVKCLAVDVVDRNTDLFVLSQKGYRSADAEYLDTVEGTVRGVWSDLVAAGGSPHLINSVKQRPVPDGSYQLSDAHVVWIHDDGSQTEAYLFGNRGAGTVDVYAHAETSVKDPDGHLTDPQTDGDPRGVVRSALGEQATVGA